MTVTRMDDLISREAVLDLLRKRLIETANNNVGFTCDAGQVFEDASERIRYWIDELPSAQPKKGKWIDRGDDYVLRWECSECKYRNSHIFNYCPDCGAYMRTEDGEWA